MHKGGRGQPDGERRADRHGQRGGPGAGAQLPDLVAGGRLGAKLSEEEAAQCRQQDAQAQERGIHEGSVNPFL